MATREAFINRLPSKTLRKAAHAVDCRIGDQPNTTLNFDEFAELAHVSRAVVARTLRALQAVGLVSVGKGPMRVSVLAKADGWKRLDADDVEARLALAKAPLLQGRPRTATASRPKGRPAAETIEPDDIEPPVRCQPSLPRLRFMEGWPER